MKKGFTLIELLVVISIIGILASLTFVSYSGAQKQTRDTERRSDLAQYRNGLENYAAANDGLYPGYTEIKVASTNPCDVIAPNFISSCPEGSTYDYHYSSNGSDDTGAATAIQYVLWTQLETGGYWEVCSNGKTGNAGEDAPTSTSGGCDL